MTTVAHAFKQFIAREKVKVKRKAIKQVMVESEEQQ
jgi:hypothetical protein